MTDYTARPAPNIWTDWLQRNVSTGHASEQLPDYCNEVLRKRGLSLSQTCQGCVHLRHVQVKDKGGQITQDYHLCTYHGRGNHWKPTWPACGDYDKRERKAKDASVHPG